MKLRSKWLFTSHLPSSYPVKPFITGENEKCGTYVVSENCVFFNKFLKFAKIK